MNLASAFLALSMLTACADTVDRAYSGRVPFNDDFIDQPGSSSAAKARLQYYLSSDVTLVVNRGVAPHITSNGRAADPVADEISLPAGTAARALASGDGWLALSFSKGTYLYFVSGMSTHNPRVRTARPPNRYYLYTSDIPDSVPQVRIGDKTYETSGDSADVYLLVDAEALSSPQKDSVITNTLPDEWLQARPH